MSVFITNISKHDDAVGSNQYVVRINSGPALAYFSHVRSEGLATCLRRAADALDNQAVGEMEAFSETLLREGRAALSREEGR